MTSQDRVAKQFSALLEVLGAIDQSAVMNVIHRLEKVRADNGMVWVIGNGGSSATASHFANDLHKAAHVRAIALSDMTATVTAYGNDSGWGAMYSHALHMLMLSQDCLVAISCSGKSQNICDAARMVGEKRLVILTGNHGPRNTLATMTNSGVVYAQHDDIKVQESAHVAICHAIVDGLTVDPLDPDVSAKCKHLRHNCPKCKKHLTTPELVEVCPDCGGDMHCGNPPVYGSAYCAAHGGPVPSRGWYGPGRAIVSGEGSRFPIARLAAKYLELTHDGRYLSNRNSIEIIRTRVTQLAERIDHNEAPDRLASIVRLWTEYRLIGGGHADGPDAIKVRLQLDATIEAAVTDYAAWQQMMEALDLDRKLVESEVKIAKDLKAILTAEDAYELEAKLLAAIIDAASSLIGDDAIRGRFLKRIQYEFARLVGDRGSRETDAGLGGSGGEILDSVASSVD